MRNTLPEKIGLLFQHLNTNESLGVIEAAALLEADKSSVSRLLSALTTQEVLNRGQDRRYRPGPVIIQAALGYLQRLDIRTTVRPYLEELHRQTKETVSFGIWTDGRAICIDKIDSLHGLKITAEIGRQFPHHAGAAPKVILAFLPEEQLEAALQQCDFHVFTERTIRNREQLLERLDEVRKAGYCLSASEVDMGATAVAAPVFDHTNRVVGALSLVAPTGRMDGEVLAEAVRTLKHGALVSSGALGAGPNQLQILR